MPLFCPLQECSILKLQSVSFSLHLQPCMHPAGVPALPFSVTGVQAHQMQPHGCNWSCRQSRLWLPTSRGSLQSTSRIGRAERCGSQSRCHISPYFSIATVLAIILLAVSFLASTRRPAPKKISAYECGLDPFDDARSRFDVQFYLVATLFITFDLIQCLQTLAVT